MTRLPTERTPSQGMSTEDVLRLLESVAAEIITPRFRALADHHVSEKAPGSLVTIADHEAEVAITEELRRAYPEAVVLGEEAYEADRSILADYAAADHAFTVDPVDGTRNFVHGSADHAVMVAELVGGRTTRAWIWQPEHGVAWTAERGAGTFRNGERQHRRPVPPGTEPSGASSMKSLRRLLGGRVRPSWYCCGVDYPRLVEGRTDFLVYKKAFPWDHAPGSLIVTEAGGRVGYADGAAYDPRSLRPAIVAAADEASFDSVSRLVHDSLASVP